jgi:hypothetical protein
MNPQRKLIPKIQSHSPRLAMKKWLEKNPGMLPCEGVKKLPEWLDCVNWANKQIYVNVRQ